MEEESGLVDHGSRGFPSASVGAFKDRRHRTCQLYLVQTSNTLQPNNNFIIFTKLGTLARIQEFISRYRHRSSLPRSLERDVALSNARGSIAMFGLVCSQPNDRKCRFF
jgi:hypothetical protein